MKLVTFEIAGAVSYGIVQDNQVYDAGKGLGNRYADLKAVLVANALSEVEAASRQTEPLPLSDVTFLPPITNPAKIFCIGHNYEEHRKEMERPATLYPSTFLRFADSQMGHLQPAIIPHVSTQIDYEGELAVIIGKPGRYIAKEQALSHVAGYSCYNDISVRDWQKHTTQFIPGKNFPGTGAFGPWMVTADEIPDPQQLELTTRLNGEMMQHASTEQMIFSVAELIAYCSSFTPLSPGDIIVSGTPGGVGVRRSPQVFMKPGDQVEVEISHIGLLRNELTAEPA